MPPAQPAVAAELLLSRTIGTGIAFGFLVTGSGLGNYATIHQALLLIPSSSRSRSAISAGSFCPPTTKSVMLLRSAFLARGESSSRIATSEVRLDDQATRPGVGGEQADLPAPVLGHIGTCVDCQRS